MAIGDVLKVAMILFIGGVITLLLTPPLQEYVSFEAAMPATVAITMLWGLFGHVDE